MDAGEQTNNREEDTPRADLWRFAVGVYGNPGVAEACLSAQQRWGIDVNLLLYACWCVRRGGCLTPDDLRRAEERCRSWREGVVLPLRGQREQWRDASECRADYEAIKDLELQAERRQLEFLADLFAQDHGSDPVIRSAAQAPAGHLDEQLKELAKHYCLEEDAFADFSAAVLKA
ncbi:TIGR02444 family protein [Congregibacter litoralis]|uniref:TIGR02444 family protein n=1 Tax=Congregibacter litoralis KT71 TaxID=314285 RepID=A4A9G7_9GAMM|nr:TIGR02444 family protein [Congregibacter litoralis]EAQ97134.1 hypothetical protein KT71_07139 [Congregibacter litoralis KT71]